MTDPKPIQSILFICTGNICRSPLAEGIARKLCREMKLSLTIDSAATSGYHAGEPPCPGSRKVAGLHGIDITGSRARRVTLEDPLLFDLLVVMDESNRAVLEARGITDVVKLGDFGAGGSDVPDPYYYEGFEGFHQVYAMVETCTKALLESVQKHPFPGA